MKLQYIARKVEESRFVDTVTESRKNQREEWMDIHEESTRFRLEILLEAARKEN